MEELRYGMVETFSGRRLKSEDPYKVWHGLVNFFKSDVKLTTWSFPIDGNNRDPVLHHFTGDSNVLVWMKYPEQT